MGRVPSAQDGDLRYPALRLSLPLPSFLWVRLNLRGAAVSFIPLASDGTVVSLFIFVTNILQQKSCRFVWFGIYHSFIRCILKDF